MIWRSKNQAAENYICTKTSSQIFRSVQWITAALLYASLFEICSSLLVACTATVFSLKIWSSNKYYKRVYLKSNMLKRVMTFSITEWHSPSLYLLTELMENTSCGLKYRSYNCKYKDLSVAVTQITN